MYVVCCNYFSDTEGRAGIEMSVCAYAGQIPQNSTRSVPVPGPNPTDMVSNGSFGVNPLGCLLDDQQRAKAIAFLMGGVQTSTSASYAGHWKRWEKFHQENGSTDVYLSHLKDNDTARAVIWTLFIYDLYSGGLRAEQVHSVLSGVRYYLLTSLSGIAFLSDESIALARKAVRRSPEEQRVYLEEKRLRAQLPVSVDMLGNMRNFLWKEDMWGFDDLLDKAIWLASCLSFDRGPRLGNISLKNGQHAVDHNIRCKSAYFSVKTLDGPVKKIAAGPGLVGVNLRLVDSMTIEIPTSKTTGSGRKHQLEPILISRTTDLSSQLLDDFVRFVQHSGASGEDPLFSFYRQSEKTGLTALKKLVRKEITSAIKACAVRCGLPPRYFSGNSLRKGTATQLSLGGLPAEDRNIAGGWARDSKVPDLHYDASRRVRGALDAAGNNGASSLSTKDLQAMFPI